MPGDPRRRFDLVFSGELLPDTSPESARATLAAFFGTRDMRAVDIFFRGRSLPLRRNLPRRDAAQLYREMRSAGLLCELRPLPLPENAVAAAAPPPAAGTARADAPPRPALTGATPAPLRREAPPNPFALRPALALRGDGPRQRSLVAAMITATAAAAALLLLLALQLRFPAAPPPPPPGAITAAAAAPDGRLLLLADNHLLLHGRSGRGLGDLAAADLGLAQLQAPLAVDGRGRVLVGGRRETGGEERLWRCSLDALPCTAATAQPLPAAAVSGDALGELLFLHTRDGRLLRIAGDGRVQEQRELPLHDGRPRLLDVDGLLIAPLAAAPMLGVYRSDQRDFGAQLDALLLLRADGEPPQALRDVTVAGDGYWALIDDGRRALLQYYDRQWQPGAASSLPANARPQFIEGWGAAVLVGTRGGHRLLRFSAAGEPLQPLRPPLLEARQEAREAALRSARWRRLGNALGLLAVAAAALLAALQWLLYRHLGERPPARTALLDPRGPAPDWLPLDARAAARRRRVGAALVALPLLAMPAAGPGSAALLLLPALGTAGMSLYLLWPSPGYLARVGGHLLAVSADGRYELRPRAQLRRCGPWLLLGDIAVPAGLGHLEHRALAAAGLAQAPPAGRGRLLGALWGQRHPWLLAALLQPGGWALSVTLLVATGTG